MADEDEDRVLHKPTNYWWPQVAFKGPTMVIPKVTRKELLRKVREGHMGIEQCRRHARDVMYWFVMNAKIADMVNQCDAAPQTCH